MSEKGRGQEPAGVDAGDQDTAATVDTGLARDMSGDEVAIEVRSDYILDSSGDAIDSDAIGGRPPLTGGGTPGGTPP